MLKPKPRNKFANEADRLEHLENVVCWLAAEQSSLELDCPQEELGELADAIKQLVREGRVSIDFHPDGERAKLSLSRKN